MHVLTHAPVADLLFRDALALGAESVTGLPASDAWLVELLTDVGDGAGPPGVTIGVVGGSGGAGATVFAAALAQAASSVGPTLLVDADPLGAGIDRVLGLESASGVRWDSLLQTTGRLSSRSLREALPHADDLAVLTWPARGQGVLQPFAMREVLSAGGRGFDAVVIDLPATATPWWRRRSAAATTSCVVSTLTVPGVTSAARVAHGLPESSPRRHLVTRGGRGGVPPESVARLLRTPLLATMSDQRGLDESIDLGAGPARSRRGVLARTARQVVDELVARGRAAAA